ncbi:MAG TPA: metal-dependent hydrolase [Methanoregula sp.]|nr:metal-dependent hydrolase [Methanoregula sp.]
MISEHIIYSTAIAIIVGMLYYRYTGRDHSWIIILCAWIPDFDIIAKSALNKLGFIVLFDGQPIHHGTFHTVAMMVIFAILVAFLLHPFGIRFIDSLFFATIGFGTHLFEDALVYKVGYMYLWPFITENLGIGILPNIISEENYFRDFFWVANTEVLIIGILVLIAAMLIRTSVEGTSWIRFYLPESMYKKISGQKGT